MKKLSKIMSELGFDPQGSEAVKKAFINNLIQSANAQEVRPKRSEPSKPKGQQLELGDWFKKTGSWDR